MLYIPGSIDDWLEAAQGAYYRTLSGAMLQAQLDADWRAAEARLWARWRAAYG